MSRPPARGSAWRLAEAIFARQHGLATRSQVLAAGVSLAQLRTAVLQARWEPRGSGLYAPVNWPNSAERSLHAACLWYDGVASHESAAWLWGLLKREPPVPVVSVPHNRRPVVATDGASARSRARGGIPRQRDSASKPRPSPTRAPPIGRASRRPTRCAPSSI